MPLFTIAQINVQKGEERMRPWFFSMGHLMQLWRNSTQNSTDADVYKQGEVHLSSLRELCDAMREPSPVDYRKFLFVAYEGASEAVASTSGEAGAKPAGSADQVGDAVAAAVEDAGSGGPRRLERGRALRLGRARPVAAQGRLLPGAAHTLSVRAGCVRGGTQNGARFRFAACHSDRALGFPLGQYARSLHFARPRDAGCARA